MATFTQNITQALTVTDSVNPVYVRVNNPGLSDNLQVQQILTYELVPDPRRLTVHHSIGVAQVITASKIKPQAHAISVAQTIGVGRDSLKELTDHISVDHFVTFYLDQGYRFINPAILNYIAGLTAGKVKFETLDSVTELVIRKPDFGDSDSYEVFRVQRNSRGGDLQIYSDPMWPTTEILEMKFSYLSGTEAGDLLDFMDATNGAKINFTDHYGRKWEGFILTPEAAVIQDKRVGFNITIRFQGVVVDS